MNFDKKKPRHFEKGKLKLCITIQFETSCHEFQFESHSLLSINEIVFVDVSMDPKCTSKVQEHFKLEKFAGIVQCNECDAILKAKDSATTRLLKYLRTIHQIDVMKQKTQQKPAAEISIWCTKPNKPTESTKK